MQLCVYMFIHECLHTCLGPVPESPTGSQTVLWFCKAGGSMGGFPSETGMGFVFGPPRSSLASGKRMLLSVDQ